MAIGNPKVIGGQCNENEHWIECGSACGDAMCDGSHESGRCIQACVPRCECDEGMFRNDNGNCVQAPAVASIIFPPLDFPPSDLLPLLSLSQRIIAGNS